MDDSGSHDGAPVSVIAGYFGGHRRWAEFEPRWEKVLKDYGVTEFHAQHFWKRNKDPRRGPKQGRDYNEFDGWSQERADAFLDSLLTIIEDSNSIHPFASGVLATEWNQQSIDDRRMFTGASKLHPSGKPSKSMFLSFQRCVIRTATYCKPGIRVHYFIDEDKQTDAWATICYGELKRKYKEDRDDISDSLGDLTPVDSVVARPVQAADLLAYEAKLYCEQMIANGGKEPTTMRVPYIIALRNIRSIDDFWLFNKARFETFEQVRIKAIAK